MGEGNRLLESIWRSSSEMRGLIPRYENHWRDNRVPPFLCSPLSLGCMYHYSDRAHFYLPNIFRTADVILNKIETQISLLNIFRDNIVPAGCASSLRPSPL